MIGLFKKQKRREKGNWLASKHIPEDATIKGGRHSASVEELRQSDADEKATRLGPTPTKNPAKGSEANLSTQKRGKGGEGDP